VVATVPVIAWDSATSYITVKKFGERPWRTGNISTCVQGRPTKTMIALDKRFCSGRLRWHTASGPCRRLQLPHSTVHDVHKLLTCVQIASLAAHQTSRRWL
jgi:hypothetical protein